MNLHSRLSVSALLTFLLVGTTFAQTSPGDEAARSADLFSMDIEGLLNVKVTTASKFAEDLSGAPGVMTVVTADELRRFGGITVKKVLERVPGLFTSTASFTDRSLISARGDQTRINGGHILYLINGRPTREVLEGGIATDLLESFPVSALDRIEVIKGPGSVLYGSNAFSAVINLITRKPVGNDAMVTEMIAGGTNSFTSARFSAVRGNLSLLGAGQYHQNPSTPVFTRDPMWWDSRTHTVDKGNGAFLNLNYKRLTILSSFDEHRNTYWEAGDGVARWRRGFADIGYSIPVNDRWEMAFNFTYTRTSLEASRYIPNIDRDSYEVVAEWTNTIRFGTDDRLTFGTAFNHLAGVQRAYDGPAPRNIVEGNQRGAALYAQLEKALGDKVKVVGGIQGNKVTRLDADLVPRLGVIFSPTSRWTLKALYSKAFHAPSLHENWLHYDPPPGIPAPMLRGNPGLLAEKIATIDLAAVYQGKRFQTTVDYFHSDMRNRILLVADAMFTLVEYANRGKTVFQGFEADGKYYIGSHLFAAASFIRQTNHDASGAGNITPIPSYGAKIGLSGETHNGFSLGLFDVYQGSFPGMTNTFNPPPDSHHLLGSNFRLDLYKWMPSPANRGLAIVATADNLLNRQVWLPNWPDNPADTIFTRRGRTVYFGVEFSLARD